MALAIFLAPRKKARLEAGLIAYRIRLHGSRSRQKAGPASLWSTFARSLVFQSSCLAWVPKVALQVYAKFDHRDAFAFKELSLEQGVWAMNQDFSAVADHAVPGNAFSGRSGGHGASGRAGAAGQAQKPSHPSIS